MAVTDLSNDELRVIAYGAFDDASAAAVRGNEELEAAMRQLSINACLLLLLRKT